MFFIIIIYINLLLTRQFEKQSLAYTENFYVSKYYKMKNEKRSIVDINVLAGNLSLIITCNSDDDTSFIPSNQKEDTQIRLIISYSTNPVDINPLINPYLTSLCFNR